MKKWLRRTLMAAALVGLTLGILYETATRVGRGWLCGEAFFHGRPTSYWRSVIAAEVSGPDPFDDDRQPTFWESVCEKCGIRTERQRSNVLITLTDVDAVLAELRQDRSPRVRAFAAAIIDYNTNELPRLAETKWTCGMDVIEKGIAWHRALHRARTLPDTE
jgi:hypothetical protein